MDDLFDAVESLKRVVARPGTFTSFYPETTDDDLAATLADGLAEVQLDGMLKDVVYDDGTGLVAPDLSRAQVALVVLYAGAILIKAELLNRKTQRRYEASGAVFDETQATNILRDILRGMEARKKAVSEAAAAADFEGAFFMADAYVWRSRDAVPGAFAQPYAYDTVGG